jgi:hypothetical protein
MKLNMYLHIINGNEIFLYVRKTVTWKETLFIVLTKIMASYYSNSHEVQHWQLEHF